MQLPGRAKKRCEKRWCLRLEFRPRRASTCQWPFPSRKWSRDGRALGPNGRLDVVGIGYRFTPSCFWMGGWSEDEVGDGKAAEAAVEDGTSSSLDALQPAQTEIRSGAQTSASDRFPLSEVPGPDTASFKDGTTGGRG